MERLTFVRAIHRNFRGVRSPRPSNCRVSRRLRSARWKPDRFGEATPSWSPLPWSRLDDGESRAARRDSRVRRREKWVASPCRSAQGSQYCCCCIRPSRSSNRSDGLEAGPRPRPDDPASRCKSCRTPETVGQRVVTVPLDHGGFEHSLDFQRFGHQHRRLIG